MCEGGVAPFAHPFFGLIRSVAEQLHYLHDYYCYPESVSLPEFGRRLYDLGALEEDVKKAVDDYGQLFDEITAIDSAIGLLAFELIHQTPGRLPLVDALIAAAASSKEGCSVPTCSKR